MLDLKGRWSNLPPRWQRYIMVGGVLGAFVVVGVAWPGEERKSLTDRRRQAVAPTNLLSARDTRNISLDAMAANLREVEAKNAELTRQVKEMRDRAGAIPPDEQAAMIKALQEELKKVQASMARVETTNSDAEAALTRLAREKKKEEQDPKKAVEPAKRPSGAMGGKPAPAVAHSEAPADDNLFASGAAPPPTAPVGGATAPAAAPAEGTKPATGAIRTIVAAKEEKVAEPDRPGTPEETLAAYLPAGSMVTGVLVTGMDAATGKGAMRDPMPALFRVKHEAILPNRYRSDIRECFMLLGGYGDLSAERAMLRGETISCVRKDGRILEASLPAYAVGEDGKVGVRGRLVSKTGQLLANALMAGFAEGVSKAFDVRPIPVISTTPSSTTQYQSSFSVESAQSAAVGGVGSALDRIAQFYIDMAGETFPVVEVDAGRRIDLILSKGVALKFMDPTKKMTPDAVMPGVPAAAMTVMPPGMAPLMGAANAAQQSGFFRFGQTLPR